MYFPAGRRWKVFRPSTPVKLMRIGSDSSVIVSPVSQSVVVVVVMLSCASWVDRIPDHNVEQTFHCRIPHNHGNTWNPTLSRIRFVPICLNVTDIGSPLRLNL